MTKCVIICRVSTYTQGTKHSLDMQENYLQTYATNNRYVVVDSIKEIGSAWRKKSKILDKFLNILKYHTNTKFLLSDVSRLCRCLKTGKTILNIIKKNNNEIIFVSQGISIPEMKRKFKTQLKYAHIESKRISDRVKMSKQFLKKRGIFYGGVPKFGYHKKNTPTGKNILVPNKKERRVILFINACKKTDLTKKELSSEISMLKKFFKRHVKHKMPQPNKKITFYDISNILNSCKIFNRKKKWTKNSVSRIYRKNKNII